MTATLTRPALDLSKSFYTADETAEVFGVNRETVYRWVRKKTIKHCPRNGRALRFLPEHLEEYLNGPKPGLEPETPHIARNPKYANK